MLSLSLLGLMLSQQLFVPWTIFSRELGEGLSRVETVSDSRCRAECLERTHVRNAVVNNVILFPPPCVYKKKKQAQGIGNGAQGSPGNCRSSSLREEAREHLSGLLRKIWHRAEDFKGEKKRKPFSTAFQTLPASVSGTLQKNQAENAPPPPTSTLQTGFQVTQ